MTRKLEPARSDPTTAQDDDDPSLVSRTDVRRGQRRREAQLLALAGRLAALKPAQLPKLELTEAQLEILDELSVIESAAARNRALKRLRAELRDVDLEALERRMSALTDPRLARVPDEAAVWCARLMAGGDPDLNAFMDRFPVADRTQLRMLARRAVRAQPSEQRKAMHKLELALGAAMQAESGAGVDPR